MIEAGILEAKGGKVRLLKRSELKSDWNPNSDNRTPDWEIAQYLIHQLDQKGEMGAAELLAKLGGRGEIARDLAYRLYSLCDRKGWTQEALAYNSLVISWPEISRLALEVKTHPSKPPYSNLRALCGSYSPRRHKDYPTLTHYELQRFQTQPIG